MPHEKIQEFIPSSGYEGWIITAFANKSNEIRKVNFHMLEYQVKVHERVSIDFMWTWKAQKKLFLLNLKLVLEYWHHVDIWPKLFLIQSE